MSGRRSRDKGARAPSCGRCRRQASRIRRAYRCPMLPGSFLWRCRDAAHGRDLCLEVKARADGFPELYGWLNGRGVLIVKADRQEPLVVVRLSLAAEIVEKGIT